MKLYVWKDVLYDWAGGSGGIAFALAESPEEAIQMLRKAGLSEYDISGVCVSAHRGSWVAPEVIEGPYANFAYGGG